MHKINFSQLLDKNFTRKMQVRFISPSTNIIVESYHPKLCMWTIGCRASPLVNSFMLFGEESTKFLVTPTEAFRV
jgi:hypothetical protein